MKVKFNPDNNELQYISKDTWNFWSILAFIQNYDKINQKCALNFVLSCKSKKKHISSDAYK